MLLILFSLIGVTVFLADASFAPPITPNPYTIINPATLALRVPPTVNVTINISEAAGLLGVMGDLPITMQRKVVTGIASVIGFGPPNEIIMAPVVSCMEASASECRRFTITLPRRYIPARYPEGGDAVGSPRQSQYKFIWGGTPLIVTMPTSASSLTVPWTITF